MAVDRHQSMMITITFHRTSINRIPWYYPPPFGMSTTVAHLHSIAISPVLKLSFTFWATIHHMELPGYFSDLASARQSFRCLTLITDGPPVSLAQTRLTPHLTSDFSSTPSDTSADSTRIVIGYPGGINLQ